MSNKQRYIRRPEHDRRFGHGDDFASDAWEDTTRTIDGGSWGAQTIVYAAIGYDPNQKEKATR